ncbi:lactate utilization protein C [candidate division KSB1 bacterium]|nr:lactate utilization protein C [candidate division KSB1 bacterium]RQW03447.1 MAG: lactate utilization protein C [candidate division KSB1 bacterium]
MSTREQFISTLSHALGRSAVRHAPEPLIYRHAVHTDVLKDRSLDELTDIFLDYSKTIGVDVWSTTKNQLNATLHQALKTCSIGDIVIADDPLLHELKTAHILNESGRIHVWEASGSWENNVIFAEKAAVGIAVAKMAMAESATVLLFSNAGSGRSLTLLPESTIYIIPKSVIVPRLTQAMAFVQAHKHQLPTSINFVSGPSATSDIELVRVVGVHGPVHVIHIVVTDI